jgi:hypothetical protein
MTRDEAKGILLDYRPGLTEPTSQTAQALELAQRDPILNDWFARQQAWHRNVRVELREIEIPADLKQNILRNHRQRFFWRRTEFAWAAAAAVAALIFISIFWGRSPGEELTFQAYRDRMVGFALREYRMDLLSENREEIRRYLEAQGGPADFELPPELEAAPLLGGAKLSWQGEPVSMVCFALDEREILYLFIVREEAVKEGEIPGEQPEIGPVKRLMTASWRHDGKIYLLAGPPSAGGE